MTTEPPQRRASTASARSSALGSLAQRPLASDLGTPPREGGATAGPGRAHTAEGASRLPRARSGTGNQQGRAARSSCPAASHARPSAPPWGSGLGPRGESAQRARGSDLKVPGAVNGKLFVMTNSGMVRCAGFIFLRCRRRWRWSHGKLLPPQTEPPI